MDKLSAEQRHKNMAAIRSKDTKPEMIVRRGLWKRGFRYRLNHKRLPGHPDLVLRKYRTCIFVNGCFWHGHKSNLIPTPSPKGEENLYLLTDSECCKIPQTNREFWVSKILRNQKRDQRNYALLQDNGWQVIVVWECQLKPDKIERTMREVELALNNNLLSLYKHNPLPYSTDEDEPLPMAAETPDVQTRMNHNNRQTQSKQ